MSGRDDDDRGERPKLSWSEIDKRRDGQRGRSAERAPRGAVAQARARSATKSYLAKLDAQLFSKAGRGGAAGAKLAAAVRDARGTPSFTGACRAYLAEIGPPRDAVLIGAFLDANDRDVQLAALAALAEEVGAGRLEPTPGLRSQLRVLAGSFDDEVAEVAEKVLAMP